MAFTMRHEGSRDSLTSQPKPPNGKLLPTEWLFHLKRTREANPGPLVEEICTSQHKGKSKARFKRDRHCETGPPGFTAELVTMARGWEQHRCSPTDESINELWYTVAGFKTCRPENMAPGHSKYFKLKELEKMAEERFFLASSPFVP